MDDRQTTAPAVPTDSDTPLVVDLDGTLCRTDTLHEGLLHLAATRPVTLLAMPGWVLRGRAGLKAALAERLVIEAGDLPLNAAVLEELRAARAAGRKTALVSAADQRQVDAVAGATGLFDEAHGTADGRNLKGPAKAAFLSGRFGAGGFDYMGDSRADLPVWAAARRAITVGAGAGLRAAAEAANAETRHIAPPGGRLRPVLKAMRPHQWSKNVLLFLPMLAAHNLSALPQVVLGFLAFCLTASAVYVINDLMDLAADRAHPRKSKRPFAAGDLGAGAGAGMAAILLLAALALGLLTGNPAFLGTLALYLVATFAYSLWLKRKQIIDVLMLAGLYTARIIAGAAAASVVLSPWMLGFSMFLFLSLAAVKRQAELIDLASTGRPNVGRAYVAGDLPVMRGVAISAAHSTLLVLALYISSDDVQTLYSQSHILWLILPVLLCWLLRMILKTHRGEMTDDPIVYAAGDRVSVMLGLICIVLAVIAA